jgi:hypothetical protein
VVLASGLFGEVTKKHAYKQIYAYVNFKGVCLHYNDFQGKNRFPCSESPEKI